MKFENITSHTHQGKREYQEDSFDYSDEYILVSDGVGGLAKGDIASGIVRDVWRDALTHHNINAEDLEGSVQSVVQLAIAALNTHAASNPEAEGMGATLACAIVLGGDIITIHVGDSRIYHFDKDGSIKWRSKDHSLVQELVNGGIITEEAAATHPRRNVITRVLQAKEDHQTTADIHILKNIENRDILMVCSDGINESWSDAGLTSVIIGNNDVSDIIKIIGMHCSENSNDNNTAVIARLFCGEEDQLAMAGVGVSKEHGIDVRGELNNKVELIEKSENGIVDKFNEVGRDTIDNSRTEKSISRLDKLKSSKVLLVLTGIIAVILLFLMDRSCNLKTKQHDIETNRNSIMQLDKTSLSENHPAKNVETAKALDKNIVGTSNKNAIETENVIPKEGIKLTDFDDIVVIEDKTPSEEDIYEIFKKSKRLKDAMAYLKKFPDGKYSFKIKKMINDYEAQNGKGQIDSIFIIQQ
jgi:PPM family protein phosphatase